MCAAITTFEGWIQSIATDYVSRGWLQGHLISQPARSLIGSLVFLKTTVELSLDASSSYPAAAPGVAMTNFAANHEIQTQA